eukprot:TRINITY_DN3050_c5_g1_i1.p1 TRINITY_DN3050_c5_g1~~TRINITY_DN3050_c5_g1_i1.p1  ORF type:complete len:396 (-),score=134.65 TRINITY_DN3050_c5_g1_i1:83-1270(-)
MKNKTIIFSIIGFVFISFFLRRFFESGLFKTLKPHSEFSKCAKIDVKAAEDLVVDPHTGTVLIASDSQRRQVLHGFFSSDGAIYALPEGSIRPILLQRENFPKFVPFHPHGLDFFQINGEKYVYVVNHRVPDGGETVEVFRWDGASTLYYIETFSDPLLTSINDILIVGEREFYVTNDHWFPRAASYPGSSYDTFSHIRYSIISSPLLHFFEDLFALSIGSVIYCNESNCTNVASGLKYPNGITMNQEGNVIFIAATLGRSLSVYTRDTNTGALQELHTVDLGTGVDNINRDSLGRLWIGCHPQTLRFLQHALDESGNTPAPSQVLVVGPPASILNRQYDNQQIKESDEVYTVQEVHLSLGDDISGSSVAAFHKGRVFIGPVFDDHILVCKAPNY